MLEIQHREPQFTGHLVVVFEDGPVESNFALESDRPEIVTTDPRGQRITSSLRWDANALMASWRIEGAGFEMTISFRYDLLDDGRVLQATEQLRGGGRDQDNLWVYGRS